MTTPTFKDLTTLTLRWVDVEDARATQRALIEVTPEGANLELPRGKKGDKGDKGDPGPGLWFRHLITHPSQLPQDLRQVDAGAAYPDTNSKSLWVWDGYDYLEVPNFIGLRGEPGITPNFQVGTVEPGLTASVSINETASTDEVKILDFTLPQGPKGDKGNPGPAGDGGPISSASDVDLTRPPADGEALTWNGAAWAPRSVLAPVGPWAMGPLQFNSVVQPNLGSESVSEQLIGSMTIPGLPYDWRPLIAGGVIMLKSVEGVRLDVEVHVGDAQMGDVIGRGIGQVGAQDVLEPVHIVPHYEPGVTPSAAYGVVAANTATDISVVVKRRVGTMGEWEFLRDMASLVLIALPMNLEY